MLGLIKKDLFMIKSNFKTLAILLVVYVVMIYQGEMNISFLLPFMSVVIMMSTFSYDNYNKWDSYVITLPNGRKNSVRAKYLATILFIIVTTVIITLLAIGISYIHTETIDFENVLSTIFGALFATSLLQSFMYPAIYKFGVEKARIGIFVVVFGGATIAGILAKFIDFSPMLQGLDKVGDYWMIIFPIIMILMLFVSYKVSELIYNKKEF